MESISKSYITKDQALEKYTFLTKNMLKNILFTNPRGFRNRVVRRLGRRILLDEQELLLFISESKDSSVKNK